MLLQIAAQTLPPLVLMAWLAFAPLPSVLGATVQAVAIAAVLLALTSGGLWATLSAWTPWLLWLLYGLALLLAWRRRAPRPAAGRRALWPWQPATGRASEWLSLGILLVVGGGAVVMVVDAYRARQPAGDIAVIDIAPPFARGTYLIGHGGSRPLFNPHLEALDPTRQSLRPYRGQAYALDVLRLDRLGRRARGLAPSDLEAYHIFGTAVRAPCAGEIVHAEDHHPDLPVGETDRRNPAGNHVRLACGEALLVLAHLQAESLLVSAGDAVEAGDALAAIGNSGNTSEPHLHLHAQRPGPTEAPLAGEPLQLTIDGRYLVRNDRLVP